MGSLKIVTFAGIPVKIHWSFLLLILFLGGYGYLNQMDIVDLLWFGSVVASMFVCVILHEYGHALMAKRYGVKTIDIIISPIGGLARLQKLPEKPSEELKVAIAGPLVNIAIASILFISMYLINQDLSFLNSSPDLKSIQSVNGFAGLLIGINLVLFVFNLIPAFPMDGGRILRALLTINYGRVKGTKLASIVGRVFAVGFVIYGLLTSEYILIFVGIFVFIMATNENRQVALEGVLNGGIVSDIMNKEFTRVHLSESLNTLFNSYIRGGEKNYLIFDSMGNVSGVVPEMFLKQAYKEGILETTSANEYMSKLYVEVHKDMAIRKVFDLMNNEGASMAIVKEEEEILGVIDRHVLQNYLQVLMFGAKK